MTADVIREMLGEAGVVLDGPNPWDIQVHDNRWYSRVLNEKNLGLGESYMDGWWDCGRIDEMICRVLRNGLKERLSGNLGYLFRFLPTILFNLQSHGRSHQIAERHYDLGNDLFFAFLDSRHQYSCGYFEGTDDLDQAQRNKMALICSKLNLSSKDHLLDIGCGWGGLARYAAEQYGCAVTAVNISKEQMRYARESCQGLPITFLEEDYRTLTGQFDKIVSVGMFEHVGRKNYGTFMEVAHRSLKTDGIFLLHTIGCNISRINCDPWINRYIFPNSALPSLQQITRAAENRFVVEDVHNLAPHYEKTLLAWNSRFQQAWLQLQGRYDARFKRMWEYYLLCFAGAFRARTLQVWQIAMTRHGTGTPHPRCRMDRLEPGQPEVLDPVHLPPR